MTEFDDTSSVDAHALNSQLRESIVEHLLVGFIQRYLWRLGVYDAEVLRSEFDAAGYDLVVSRGDIVRHLQLKAARKGGGTDAVKVSTKLAAKPSGCVVWVEVDDDLEMCDFLWFGAAPGEPLPDMSALKLARHTKANALGQKGERPNHRILPKSRFRRLGSVEALAETLLGPVQ